MIRIDADRLVEDAARAYAVVPHLAPQFRDGLHVICTAINRLNIDPVARRFVHGELDRIVRQRVAASGIPKFDSPLTDSFEDLVIIIGLPRTGSTLLHNLLDRDDACKTVPLWKATFPFERDAPGRLIRIVSEQLRFANRVSPSLQPLHPMRATAPEECITLMELTMHSQRLQMLLALPEYDQWLNDTNTREAYMNYRAILQSVIGTRGRIVLKAPAHLLALSDCVAVFPEAKLVWLHRDVAEVIGSFSALVVATNRLGSGLAAPVEVGPFWLERWVSALELAQDVHEGRYAVHLRASRLFSDTDAALDQLYRGLLWERSDDTRARQLTWLATRGGEYRNTCRYRPSDFGIDSGSLAKASGRAAWATESYQ